MGELFIVPPVCSGHVAGGQRSGVRRGEDALQVLDFGNNLLGVHGFYHLITKREAVGCCAYRSTNAPSEVGHASTWSKR